MYLVGWWGSPSHGRGHRFDTCRAHHKPPAHSGYPPLPHPPVTPAWQRRGNGSRPSRRQVVVFSDRYRPTRRARMARLSRHIADVPTFSWREPGTEGRMDGKPVSVYVRTEDDDPEPYVAASWAGWPSVPLTPEQAEALSR